MKTRAWTRWLATMGILVVAAACSGVAEQRPSALAASSTPTEAPTPSEAPTPTEASIPSPTPVPSLPDGEVTPGTYRMSFDEGSLVSNPAFVTLTVPAGWKTPRPAGPPITKGSDASPLTWMDVDVWDIAKVYQDPCHSISIPAVAVSPTVDDLVAALAGQKRHGQIVTPVDVTIDGYHGKQIDLMVPLNVVFAGFSNASTCEGGQYSSWEDPDGGQRYNQGPGQSDLLDMLDVNGRTLVIQRTFFPANTAADRAELQAIVDSIKITP